MAHEVRANRRASRNPQDPADGHARAGGRLHGRSLAPPAASRGRFWNPSGGGRVSCTEGERLKSKFLLWLLLLVVCWPLALLALVLYPIVWLLLLPFRLLGIAVDGVFALLKAVLMLPARVLRGPQSA